MMNSKITPILTEKSLSEAARGRYSFYIPRELNKFQIKELIAEIYDVHPVSVQTARAKSGKKRNAHGRFVKERGAKKTIVTLKGKEKIDVFNSQ